MWLNKKNKKWRKVENYQNYFFLIDDLKKKKNIKTLNRRYVNKCKTEGQLYIIFQIRSSMRLSNKILKEVCYLRKT